MPPVSSHPFTVSVVIPAYNAGRLVDDAIASVLRQDLAAHEIIVVNDGSTDRDYAELANIHHSVKTLHQPNRGVSAARNAGCEAATGEYVAILDADDIWMPGKLRAQMSHLSQHSDVDAAFCRGLLWVPSQTAAPPPAHHLERSAAATAPRIIHLRYPDFLCSIPVAPSTLVIKKSVWEALRGFNEQLRYGEDHDFYLRLSHSHSVDLLDMIGMLYRKHSTSVTAKIQEKNHLADVITRTIATLGDTDRFGNRVEKSRLAKHLTYLHLEHGYGHFMAGNFEIAKREFSLAVKKQPSNIKALLYLAVASLPRLRDFVRNSRHPAPNHEDGRVI